MHLQSGVMFSPVFTTLKELCVWCVDYELEHYEWDVEKQKGSDRYLTVDEWFEELRDGVGE